MLVMSLLATSCKPVVTIDDIRQETPSTQRESVPGSIMQWDSPPEMSINQDSIYIAILKTEKGDIRIELFANRTPKTVNNFIFLAKEGFYDNTTFHRVLPDFMAQGGDPTGTGGGGPGYSFDDEFDPSLRFDSAGYLAMANSGPNTNGSQFFITFSPLDYLNGRHAIFGKVIEGMDVALSLTLRDPQEAPDFLGDSLITIEIEEVPESLLPTPTPTLVPVVPILEEGRPLAAFEIAGRENIYSGKPELVINPTKTYIATIDTTQGDIRVELRPQFAPESVNNFYVLAELGYWDGFPIVYIEPELLVLTGSPTGQLDSDVGYSLPLEVGLPNTAGAVGFVFRNDILASSGSQFYILLNEVREFDGQFAVFGYVIEGLDKAQSLTLEDSIEKITVIEK
jgi:cyclophilin family peptidyl-prolyl cis-trans isomerase